jgi:hypothetical protein
MDRTSRSIILSLLALTAFVVGIIVVSLVVSFNVEQSVTIKDFSGVIEIITPDDTRTQYDASQTNPTVTLKPDHRLRLLPGSTATITFFNTGGRVHITGPGTLTLVAAYRRGTLLGHTSDRFERDYVLTLAQNGGSAQYNFHNTTPAFAGIDITLQLPNGNYSPASPCWRVEISDDGAVNTLPFEC